MDILNDILGRCLATIYQHVPQFPLAILVLTLLTKVILFPLSLWLHKNTIKMAKIQGEINRIKCNYFGNGEKISEEQARLFKEVGYNPFLSVLPLMVQILLLVSLIDIIYHPLTYLSQISSEELLAFLELVAEVSPFPLESNGVQLEMIRIAQLPEHSTTLLALGFQETVLQFLSEFQYQLGGFNFLEIPIYAGGVSLFVPFLAGISAFLLCVTQNRCNALQSQQSKMTQYGTLLFSVGISLFLGLYVPISIGFYWIISNLYGIVQTFFLNYMINPRKFVDQEALAESIKNLEELQQHTAEKQRLFEKNPYKGREKEDYKRFFSINGKKIVFYSESKGFYKYYKGLIEELLLRSNLSIHYITSDPKDNIFELAKSQPKIKPYLIREKKLIVLMMKMDAEMVVMTTPNLETYHLKRSLVKEDVEYIFVLHGPLSIHMAMEKGSCDHFDTVFCVGPRIKEEIRKTEEVYQLPEKNLVECGYSVLEDLVSIYEEKMYSQTSIPESPHKILIAPSWQKDNIMDLCVEELLDSLKNRSDLVIIRPHPEYVKRKSAYLDQLKSKYPQYIFETDFSSNDSILTADVLISDWSGIAYEYAFSTKKPVLFIDTPMKIMNPEYSKIGLEPLEITLRNEVGISVALNELQFLPEKLDELLDNKEKYAEKTSVLVDELFYHFGNSSKVGADYILNQLKKR